MGGDPGKERGEGRGGSKEEHRCGVDGMFVSPLKFVSLNPKRPRRWPLEG